MIFTSRLVITIYLFVVNLVLQSSAHDQSVYFYRLRLAEAIAPAARKTFVSVTLHSFHGEEFKNQLPRYTIVRAEYSRTKYAAGPLS